MAHDSVTSTPPVSVPFTGHNIYPYQQWPPSLRIVTREAAVALTVTEIIDLVKAGIIQPEKAAELLGL